MVAILFSPKRSTRIQSIKFVTFILFSIFSDNTVNAQTDNNNDFIVFDHFIADDSKMRCWSDEHATMFNAQVRGVCLGGWLVLEPWITPSLFYQFLGGTETTAAGDMMNFCRVLGPKEGNRQLRRHWDTWVTEDIIKELAESKTINSLRLPVGDWMYKPYEPYIGCTDGALDYVDKLLGWAETYGLSVLLDIHGVKGSQNGFDNSGQSMGFEWTSVLNTEPKGLVTFEHWPIRSAGWMGSFDRDTTTYTTYNADNVNHTLQVIHEVVDKYKDHPAVFGLEPVNEPWQYTPIDKLKRFYWEGYKIVKTKADNWKYVMHDSFRLDPNIWGGFMAGCPDRAMDTHIYQAWNFPGSRAEFYNDACSQKDNIAAIENAFGPVVVGEWSLATDNCAMWLNGFNDNLSGYPMLPCKYMPCPDPYMGPDQPGTPVDPAKPIQGPFGTGMSGPSFGMCPVDRDWVADTSDTSNYMHAPPTAPEGLDDTDNVMKNLALKKINTFSGIGHGFYFWNFRTELDEPQWSYLLALRRGWVSLDNLEVDKVRDACVKEDTGQYKCVCKRGMLDKNVRNGCLYVLYSENNNTEARVDKINNLTGEDLAQEADILFTRYWADNRIAGATCDFGGVAQLMELNYTYVPPPPPPGPTIEQQAIRPLVAISIGIGFIFFMMAFALCVFRIGGYVKERNLRSLGAIRKSFKGLVFYDTEDTTLLT